MLRHGRYVVIIVVIMNCDQTSPHYDGDCLRCPLDRALYMQLAVDLISNHRYTIHWTTDMTFPFMNANVMTIHTLYILALFNTMKYSMVVD